ncbi:S49 family peptidase [Rhodovibrio salinarum]|uniref:S49 family peptidase n=1 Tax=Rhodovibrio salinarum TaxID=1087 RepID=A0A934V2C7_9PROT|nr:S49 family peptidase [Rhodovibrio salinarum]MBK1698714.1 S49 family peptidase [Rhodovibrio salinarum]
MIYKLISRIPGLRRFSKNKPVVPVLRLNGAIGQGGALRSGLTASALAEPIRRAFSTSGAKAVALAVNSPGGSPVQSELIASRIRQHAEEKDLKVYVFCEDVAASGGYWLACAGDEIYASKASIVGSIGVVAAGFGFQDLIQRYGVERRVHTSGEKKVILDPFQKEDPDEVARLKEIQAEIHEHFKAMVRDRRQGKLNAEESELFSGAFWTGQEAYKLGLIDGLGELRQTLRGVFGEKVRLPLVEPKQSWLKRKFGGASLSTFFDGAGDGSWAGDLLSAAEERALWSRYGL